MIRARFQANADDYRPVNWPVKHPYWCTGYGGEDGEEYAVVVAYADDEAEITHNWPEAKEIDVMEHTHEYSFTSRFPKPEWFKS